MKFELLEIPGVTEEQVELFEAVGVIRKAELCDFDAKQLHTELTDANGFLQICEDVPDLGRLKEWQSLVAGSQDAEANEKPAKSSKNSSVKPAGKIPTAQHSHDREAHQSYSVPWPKAIPVPVTKMVQSKVPLESIPVARVVAASTATSKTANPDVEKKPTPSASPDASKNAATNFVPKERGLMTTVLPETNLGKTEHSRSFIRGVLYPRVGDLVAGALSTILLFVFFPLAIISGIMAILNPNPWLMIAPIGLLLSALLYLVFGLKPRCRICGQGVFVSKSCHRHVKAHHIPIIGYILPTAVQMLIFRWFRCIYCGTSIRLKE